MLISSVFFLILADSTNQAGPMCCSGNHLSKSCPIVNVFWVEYLGAYAYILFLNSGDVFISCCYNIVYYYIYH